MDIGSINTVILAYIALAVFGILALLLALTGPKDVKKKNDKRIKA